MMLPATPQRTAESRLPAPAPITPPLITCVVESGKPKWVEERITAAPALGPVLVSLVALSLVALAFVRRSKQGAPVAAGADA